MKDLQYLICKAAWRFVGAKREVINNFFRKNGMHIGNNTHINCNILTNESGLIYIGDNVTIAHDVQFITHDNSISRAIPGKGNLFGRITIGDGCFIGARSTILYGVNLASDIIVAAGSVVTRSFDTPGIIIGGNPAKFISTYAAFASKYSANAVNVKGLFRNEFEKLLSDDEILVVRAAEEAKGKDKIFMHNNSVMISGGVLPLDSIIISVPRHQYENNITALFSITPQHPLAAISADDEKISFAFSFSNDSAEPYMKIVMDLLEKTKDDEVERNEQKNS